MTLSHEKLDVYQLSIGYGINENNEPYGKKDFDFDVCNFRGYARGWFLLKGRIS